MIVAGLLGLALIASAPPAADADYVAGCEAYERALAADAIDRSGDALLLREARVKLAAAIAGYRATLAADPAHDDARRRLGEATAVGKPCCGRRSLWIVYQVPAP